MTQIRRRVATYWCIANAGALQRLDAMNLAGHGAPLELAPLFNVRVDSPERLHVERL